MEYIHSNSQESLLYTKIRDNCHNDRSTEELMDYVRSECERRSLDIEKVAETIVTSIDRAGEIRSISAYVRKIVVNLNEKVFKKNRTKPLFTSLNKALDSAGIEGETWELFLIHSIEEHAINEFGVMPEDLITTNRAIIEYCKNNNVKTLSEIKDLLLKSRVLRSANIPLVVLEKNAKEYGESYDKIMKDLEEDETLYGENENA